MQKHICFFVIIDAWNVIHIDNSHFSLWYNLPNGMAVVDRVRLSQGPLPGLLSH